MSKRIDAIRAEAHDRYEFWTVLAARARKREFKAEKEANEAQSEADKWKRIGQMSDTDIAALSTVFA